MPTSYELLQQYSKLMRRVRIEKDPQNLIKMLHQLDALMIKMETVLANDQLFEPVSESGWNRRRSIMQKSGASD
jgi:hypothetical protein